MLGEYIGSVIYECMMGGLYLRVGWKGNMGGYDGSLIHGGGEGVVGYKSKVG